jgi:hypothetical protein
VPAVSAEFADLVSWLLEKNPLHRVDWQTIPSHPFWAPKVCSRPITLPPQPAYDIYTNKLKENAVAEEAAYYAREFDATSNATRTQQPASPGYTYSSPAGKQQNPSPHSKDVYTKTPPTREALASDNRDTHNTASAATSTPVKRNGVHIASSPSPASGGNRGSNGSGDVAVSSLLFCAHDSQVCLIYHCTYTRTYTYTH